MDGTRGYTEVFHLGHLPLEKIQDLINALQSSKDERAVFRGIQANIHKITSNSPTYAKFWTKKQGDEILVAMYLGPELNEDILRYTETLDLPKREEEEEVVNETDEKDSSIRGAPSPKRAAQGPETEKSTSISLDLIKGHQGNSSRQGKKSQSQIIDLSAEREEEKKQPQKRDSSISGIQPPKSAAVIPFDLAETNSFKQGSKSPSQSSQSIAIISCLEFNPSGLLPEIRLRKFLLNHYRGQIEELPRIFFTVQGGVIKNGSFLEIDFLFKLQMTLSFLLKVLLSYCKVATKTIIIVVDGTRLTSPTIALRKTC
eukprot:TRINITY_DN13528_c0_g1_i4.p1 TRINITY_DN13528_c0_g1~~TRINITY_DN13528_c0_g1_i4.p1  ORF type:complete len:314 (+),score=8.31 TRINITY_DN13528_c0_g1_i4:227-1168(+)